MVQLCSYDDYLMRFLCGKMAMMYFSLVLPYVKDISA